MVFCPLLKELHHFDAPQILMANFWCNLYIFCHLSSFEAHKPNNIAQKNLPSFHGIKPAVPVMSIFMF